MAAWFPPVLLLLWIVVEGTFAFGFALLTNKFCARYGLLRGSLPLHEDMVATHAILRSGLFDFTTFVLTFGALLSRSERVWRSVSAGISATGFMWAFNIVFFWERWSAAGAHFTRWDPVRYFSFGIAGAFAAWHGNFRQDSIISLRHPVCVGTVPWLLIISLTCVGDVFYLETWARECGIPKEHWSNMGWSYYQLFIQHAQVPAMLTNLFMVISSYSSNDLAYMRSVNLSLAIGTGSLFFFYAARQQWWITLAHMPETWMQGQLLIALSFGVAGLCSYVAAVIPGHELVSSPRKGKMIALLENQI